MPTKNRRIASALRKAGQLRQLTISAGVKLIQEFHAHAEIDSQFAWSPNGLMIAATDVKDGVRVWDPTTGAVIQVLETGPGVDHLAWSPDGRLLACGGRESYLSIWDMSAGKLVGDFKIGNLSPSHIAWSPDGKIVALLMQEGELAFWDFKEKELLKTLECPSPQLSVAWSPSGAKIATASYRLWIWDPETGRREQVTAYGLYDVAWSPINDGLIAAGSAGSKVLVFDAKRKNVRVELEGHTDHVRGVAFSSDGRFLASVGGDIRLWNCETWQPVAVISTSSRPGHTIAFHPSLPLLASLNQDPDSKTKDHVIQIWELNPDILLLPTSLSALRSVHHTTAKIVLVGDSGVGKTGLGWRLAHGEFKEHSSTHGQQFWILNQLGTLRADGTDCEAILWDLAGQPDYRLTHALFLDDADLALILFDPTDSRDPLHGVEFWLKQLTAGRVKSSESQDSCQIVLVGARTDRGEARLTADELEAFCRKRAIAGGYVPVSAKDGIGLDELLRRMKDQIAWDSKPATVTTVTFKRIKDYVLELKENSRRRKVLVSSQDLRKRLEKTNKRWKFTDNEMMTAVRHLSNYGYVRILRTSKGGERVLLSPELLNNLAASFVLEARRNQDGLGSLEEKRLLSGGYRFRELEKLSKEEQEVLLDSAALLFLKHTICFRETDLSGRSYLVYPELMNLNKPVLADDQPTEDGMSYTINGAIENIYASLVVLLGYTQTFTRRNQWRSHARYEVGDGFICGFREDGKHDGELDLVLYFGTNVGRPVRTLFQGLFESFLARRNLSVFRYEPVICSKGHVVNRTVVRDESRSGSDSVFCSKCGEKLALPKADEPIQLTQTERHKVDEQQSFANRRSRFEQAVFQLASFVESQKLKRPECFISYAWGDKEQERWVERNLGTDLQKAGLNVVLDRWENARVGASVPRFVARIEKSDRIVVVGTPLYRRKYENKDTTTGYVVAAEVDLISSRLLGTEEEKETVLPLLLSGEEKTSLPPLLQRRVFGDFRTGRDYFSTAFDLILDLYRISHGDSAVIDLRESLRNTQIN